MSLAKNKHGQTQVSILIPTYNESQNIINILKSIGEHIPKNILTQTIVIDDNSPDGTGNLVDEYITNVKKIANNTIDVIHRRAKHGLSSAILNGIQKATGDTIVVMDSDFSHPPNIIPKMIDALKQSQCDIVIASRYVTGGGINGWSLKRRLISKVATKIANKGLGVKEKDPMSGFFAFKRNIINGLKFDAIGYKMLLEILVKTKGAKVQEIPYTFTDRKLGSSKLGLSTIIDYTKAVLKLYRSGNNAANQEKRTSIRFLSKAARFYTVGASGLGVNYLMSLLFASGVTELWYIHANLVGIFASMSSNFFLNKLWTFEDKDFKPKKTASQYLKFIAFSSLGALVQLGMVYSLVENYQIDYPLALVLAVITAAFGNYILNKKWTFKEKLWS